MNQGWGKIKAAAAYAGVSERTLENWVRNGLRYTQLPSGLRLIKFKWIDEYLEAFAKDSSEENKKIDRVVDEIMAKLRGR
jgi:hypothetical protein